MIPHPEIFFGAVLFFVVALVTWSFWMIPLWSRPGIFFAVTVPVPFASSPGGRRILRRYRLHAMVNVAIGFALIVAGSRSAYWPLLILGVVWFGLGPLVAFLTAHKLAVPYAIAAPTVREAVLVPRDTRPPGGWIAQMGPFVILLATGIWLHLHWNMIPERFPSHWGVDGRPNGWTMRTPLGVYYPLLMSLILLAGMAAIAAGIHRSARGGQAAAPGSAIHGFSHRVCLFVLGVEYFLASMFSLAALIPFTGPTPLVVATLVMFPVLLILIGWLNKGRILAEDTSASPATTLLGDGTLDERWKLGVFYYNPDDAALFVERRFGVGYTVNLGHASAWIILALILFFPLGLLLLIPHAH